MEVSAHFGNGTPASQSADHIDFVDIGDIQIDPPYLNIEQTRRYVEDCEKYGCLPREIYATPTVGSSNHHVFRQALYSYRGN
jgi:hypothetical protein